MHLLTGCACLVQGPVGVSNKHVETAIDEGSGKLTMLYQVSTISIQIQTSTLCRTSSATSVRCCLSRFLAKLEIVLYKRFLRVCSTEAQGPTSNAPTVVSSS